MQAFIRILHLPFGQSFQKIGISHPLVHGHKLFCNLVLQWSLDFLGVGGWLLIPGNVLVEEAPGILSCGTAVVMGDLSVLIK